jgi:hypothetical protein
MDMVKMDNRTATWFMGLVTGFIGGVIVYAVLVLLGVM